MAAALIYLHGGNNINCTLSTVDFIQDNADTLRDKHVIIRTDSNNLLCDSRSTIEQRLERLEANLKFHKYTSCAFSSIIHCDSTQRVHENVIHINSVLQMMCVRNKWTFIDNDCIEERCLSHDSLHLNTLGYELFATTLCKGIYVNIQMYNRVIISLTRANM